MATAVGSGSDQEYAEHVRAVDADSPARYNADPRRLFEASGSAGKLILFAVRLDTFPAETQTRVFYIGTNDPGELTAIRRHMLTSLPALPIAGEYLHRDAFDIADAYGKDTFLAIRRSWVRPACPGCSRSRPASTASASASPVAEVPQRPRPAIRQPAVPRPSAQAAARIPRGLRASP